jgi:hypothetical protein
MNIEKQAMLFACFSKWAIPSGPGSKRTRVMYGPNVRAPIRPRSADAVPNDPSPKPTVRGDTPKTLGPRHAKPMVQPQLPRGAAAEAFQ